MERKELELVKENYIVLLRDLHSNIRNGKVQNIKDTIKDLILKTYSLKRKLEMQ